jgi:hypothetical protein
VILVKNPDNPMRSVINAVECAAFGHDLDQYEVSMDSEGEVCLVVHVPWYRAPFLRDWMILNTALAYLDIIDHGYPGPLQVRVVRLVA